MSGPQWTWQFLATDEAALDRPVSPAFTSRFDAEAWLGEHWRSLAADGVGAARLLHQGGAVAPPVPLRKG
nr:hypothetical protein [uncultured Actinotalea sp.]